MIRKYWIVILPILVWSLGFAAVSKPQSKTSELKHLDQQIQQLQQEIQHDQGKKGQLAQQLKGNTAKLAKLEKQSLNLKIELNQEQTNLANVQQEQKICQRRVSLQQAVLSKQLYLAYFLLNARDCKSFYLNNHDRYWTYLKYCNNAQLTNLDQLEQKFKLLSSKQSLVLYQKQEVQSVLSKQQKSQQQLTVTKQSQQQTLTALAAQIKDKNAKLDQLKANKHALEQLVKKLSQIQHSEQLSSASVFLPKGASFAALEGKLLWPISGSIVTRYGTSIGQSELKNTGVSISCRTNQSVAAVYQGKVIFANWLQGLGLLLIIDHGNGYMSLYGHNQALYKKVGDVVKARESIARVSSSPNHSIGGLYFEIRHNGQPANPEHWCRHGYAQ